MANQFRKVQLEFYLEGMKSPAVLGMDGIVWVDGRWSHHRAVEYLEERAREYCDSYNSRATSNLEWRRSVYLLGGRYRSVTV